VVKLNPGISKINMATVLLIQFTNYIALGIIYTFVTFILEDPNYYNLSASEVGANLGFIGSIAEICVIILEMFMGVILDTFGRKVPLVIGFLVSGASILSIPLFN